MTTLSDRIINAAPAAPDADRITRQIRHIETALKHEKNEQRRQFLYASFQALMWARSPDSFAPPVQMR